MEISIVISRLCATTLWKIRFTSMSHCTQENRLDAITPNRLQATKANSLYPAGAHRLQRSTPSACDLDVTTSQSRRMCSTTMRHCDAPPVQPTQRSNKCWQQHPRRRKTDRAHQAPPGTPTSHDKCGTGFRPKKRAAKWDEHQVHPLWVYLVFVLFSGPKSGPRKRTHQSRIPTSPARLHDAGQRGSRLPPVTGKDNAADHAQNTKTQAGQTFDCLCVTRT